MDHWAETTVEPSADDKYRCLFLDGIVFAYATFVMLCQDDDVRTNYTLVGEAITNDENARKGAVWFGGLGFPRAPWWKNGAAGTPDVRQGYRTEWKGDWAAQPIYFGLQDDGYPYLREPLPPPALPDAGDGNNMAFSDVYRFIVKGGTPVAQSISTQRKVGAAWDLASGRAPVSRFTRSFPRLIRGVRF